MKAVELLLRDVLPGDVYREVGNLDAKNIGVIMSRVAAEHPDEYARVIAELGRAGQSAAWRQGETLRLSDLKPVFDKEPVLAAMDKELAMARLDTRGDPDAWKKARAAIHANYADKALKLSMDGAKTNDNSLYYSVLSGARGKALQLRNMVGLTGVYTDSNDVQVPVFGRNSFGEGIRPVEALAGAYGARTSVISTKSSTAKGGDLCLDENTMVRMADFSVKRISEIEPGDWVLGCSKSGVTFPARVLHKFDQGTKEVVDYVFRSNSSRTTFVETCTPDHKFAASYHPGVSGFRRPVEVRRVGDMKGNRWHYLHPVVFDDSALSPVSHALLLGMLTGDGTLPTAEAKSRICFTNHDSTIVADTEDYMKSLGLSWRQRKTQPHQYRVSRTGPLSGGKGLRSLLFSLGMAGKRAYDKQVPDVIRHGDNASVAAFLRGYFATDGCVTTNSKGGHYYSFGSSSIELLQGLKELCGWRFGICGSSVTQIDDGGPRVIDGVDCNTLPFYNWSIGRREEVLVMDSLMVAVPGKKAELVRAFSSTKKPKPKKEVRKGFKRLRISEIKRVSRCFDIEIDHQDHLFVLASGLVCSNSKIMSQAAASLVVTKDDCGTTAGVDLDLDEPSVKGRVLAMPAAGLPAGAVLDSGTLAHLRKLGTEKIVVRSAMTCGQKLGLCSRCLGLRSNGKFAKIGDSVGIQAAQALGEPVTQMALNLKHTSGQKSGLKASYAGFKWINQFVQSPEQFDSRAAVSEEDGVVDKVEDAPQGGKYVSVNGKEHYVPPGLDVLVKAGQHVEAGDQLGDGLVDAADITRLRGLGEGRRYYAERLKQMLEDSGMKTDLRNTEMLARAAINHVTVTGSEDVGDYLPDDVAEYNRIAPSWAPPKDAKARTPAESRGMWLQDPVLHYSVGTRITPKVASRLEELGYKKITAAAEPPPFEPSMVRLRVASHYNPDWLASQHTSYLTRQLGESAVRGDDTDTASNIHFAPRLAVGEGFGDNVRETGKF
jgi:hypothetical protein